MRNNAITQHYWSRQAQVVQPVSNTDKFRCSKRKEEQSFNYILKKQIKKDPVTFILTRLAGLLICINIINQFGIWLGWW